MKSKSVLRTALILSTLAMSVASCGLIVGLNNLDDSTLLAADSGLGADGKGRDGSMQGVDACIPGKTCPPGTSWCSTHIDSHTLFCNDFDDTAYNALGTLGDNPQGPWSYIQSGSGGFTTGLSLTDDTVLSPPRSLSVTGQVLPQGLTFTLAQYATTQDSPTGVLLTFDLRVENYSPGTNDLSIVKIGTYDPIPKNSPWWVSWDYNVNTGQVAEFGSQATGAQAGFIDGNHTSVPDFTAAGFYHVMFAVDLVLNVAWWSFEPAPSTMLDASVEAGKDASDGDVRDGDNGKDAQEVGDAGLPGACSSPLPLGTDVKYSDKFPLQYLQVPGCMGTDCYKQTLPEAGSLLTIIVGENYGTDICTDTHLYFDNVRVESIPPEGLPNGPTYPVDDAGQ